MASGWASDSAVQEQIDATLDDAVARVRSQLATGESALFCEECGEPIPQARREAIPGVQLCVNCQAEADKNRPHSAVITGAAVKTVSCAETGAEHNDSAHHHFIAED